MSGPKLLNKQQAGQARAEHVRKGICNAVCPNMTFDAKCRLCRQSAEAALKAIDDFAERNVVEQQGR